MPFQLFCLLAFFFLFLFNCSQELRQFLHHIFFASSFPLHFRNWEMLTNPPANAWVLILRLYTIIKIMTKKHNFICIAVFKTQLQRASQIEDEIHHIGIMITHQCKNPSHCKRNLNILQLIFFYTSKQSNKHCIDKI